MPIRNANTIPSANRVSGRADLSRYFRASTKRPDEGSCIHHGPHIANLVSNAQALSYAEKGSMLGAKGFGTLRPMEIDRKAIGRRLRAILKEGEFRSTQAFADYLGQERGTVDSWLNGRALPPVPYLAKLHQERGITLDWLFFGDASAMPHGRLIRLQAQLMELVVPEVEEGFGPEPEPIASEPAGKLRQRRTTKKAT